jgi:hypothetical protein
VNTARRRSPAEHYVRILLIGLMAIATGSAIVGLASVGSGTGEITLLICGGFVIVFGLVLFVMGFLGQCRARPGRATFKSPRVIVRDYVEVVRGAPAGTKVRSAVAALFWCWAAIEFVWSIALKEWALAAAYGVVAVSLPLLFFITGSAVDRPGDQE